VLGHISFLGVLSLMLSLNLAVVYVVATSSDPLTQGAVWSYDVTSRSELEGKGQYEGIFTTAVTVSGHATILHVNTSIMIIEKKEAVDISTNGSGYYKQEPKRNHYEFTETSTVDRGKLTYRSRIVRTEVEKKEWEDNSTKGVPVTDFVSTSLSEGQRVQYFAIQGVVNCTVSFGKLSFQSQSVPVIILHYSGPAQKDTWLETSGAADYAFNFEKTTGLLTSSSSKTYATSQKGSRLTTYDYLLRSTSLWETGTPNQTPSKTQIPTTEVTPAVRTPTQQQPIIDLGTGYAAPIIAVGTGALVAMMLIMRRRATKDPEKEKG
jgi:hypothetical protein